MFGGRDKKKNKHFAFFCAIFFYLCAWTNCNIAILFCARFFTLRILWFIFLIQFSVITFVLILLFFLFIAVVWLTTMVRQNDIFIGNSLTGFHVCLDVFAMIFGIDSSFFLPDEMFLAYEERL